MRKYRRIVRTKESSLQGYQVAMTALGLFSALTAIIAYAYHVTLNSSPLASLHQLLQTITLLLIGGSVLAALSLIVLYRRREQVTIFPLPTMQPRSKHLATRLRRLFTDKQLSDVLKLTNQTRYGDEFPVLAVWVADDCKYGYIAIENIATYDRMDRDKYEQKVSGILSGKYQRFAVVSTELTAGDTYMLFHFEDTLTSFRIHVAAHDSLSEFISNTNPHVIQLSKDLSWHADATPHLSLIARTRAGKSVLAGRYMACLMQLQGWSVEYNSAKYDRYVKQFNGQSDPTSIVERAEYWVEVMRDRLDQINAANQDKYLDMSDMPDIGLFFDEIGNLNAALEMDKLLKKRWEIAINKLTATGGSAGIHVIAISQFATKEGFLPSLARVNCSDAVIMLGGAADSADERKYLMAGFADFPKRSYGTGQGVARFITSDKKWESPHFYEAPWFD